MGFKVGKKFHRMKQSSNFPFRIRSRSLAGSILRGENGLDIGGHGWENNVLTERNSTLCSKMALDNW
jgi:hypothetical protein